MSSFKCINLLTSLLIAISAVSSAGTFQEEVIDYVNTMYNSNVDKISSMYFFMEDFKEPRMHSKFLKFKSREDTEWGQDQNADNLKALVDSASNKVAVVNILHKQFFNQNLFNVLQDANLHSVAVKTLPVEAARDLPQVVLVLPEVKITLKDWLAENAQNLKAIDYISLWMHMILLVAEFNNTGYSYCNTRLDGFAFDKGGNLKLFDFSGVSSKICRTRSGLNPYKAIKISKKPHDVDSYGLSQAFDQMFFDQVKEVRDQLLTYKNSPVKAIMNSLFENNLAAEYSMVNDGHKTIEEFYDNLFNYKQYKASSTEANRLKLKCQDNPTENWNALVAENIDNIKQCNNYDNTFEWCSNEFLVNQCDNIIKSQEIWKSLETPLTNEGLCEIRDTIDQLCQSDNIQENFVQIFSENEVWQEFCERTQNSYCDRLNEPSAAEEICKANSSICTYSAYYQWHFQEEFKLWCDQPDKCNATSELVKWCDSNQLLILWSKESNQFYRFCQYEQHYDEIHKYMGLAVATYHMMVKEYFRSVFNTEFNNNTISTTAMQPKVPLVTRLAGPPANAKLNKNNLPFMGILHDQLFKLETRFVALFGIHFMYSFFMEREEVLKATIQENFYRVAKLGPVFKHCDLNKLFATVTAAFAKGPGAIDSQQEFKQLITFFASIGGGIPEGIKAVGLMNSLEKCRDNILGYLFMKPLKYAIAQIPERSVRFGAMIDYLYYRDQNEQAIQFII